MEGGGKAQGPHVVVIPYPLQGHIKPMMQLSSFLLSKSFTVTFVNTQINHDRLLRHTSTTSSALRLVSLPDGLPPHFHTHDAYRRQRILATEQNLVAPFSELVASLAPNITCIISDVLVSWALTVATEFGIPGAALWTSAASSFAAYSQIPSLICQGYLPVTDTQALFDQNDVITSIAGFKPIFRKKDLPSFFLVQDLNDDIPQILLRQLKLLPQARWVLSNTLHELESEVEALPQLLPIIPIGPLFALNPSNGGSRETDLDANMWTENDECLLWLNGKAPSSVLYVSFGSRTTLSTKQAEEIAMGLEASEQPFLWSLRPEMLNGEASTVIQRDFYSRTKGRGMIVSWVNQVNVLAHLSVGAFLTHCGWNSVMESVWVGKPMLGCPLLAEQRINCRLVEQGWRVGRELRAGIDGVVEKEEVERAVRWMMVGDNSLELKTTSTQLSKIARASALENEGSSARNLDNFVTELLHLPSTSCQRPPSYTQNKEKDAMGDS